jgi:hypothetical protein
LFRQSELLHARSQTCSMLSKVIYFFSRVFEEGCEYCNSPLSFERCLW